MKKAIRGVNLGGWLVLEEWITREQDPKKYITESDFEWISSHGLNAVRIPIGYWIFGDQEPFKGVIESLDWAMKIAQKYGLGVVIDLHGAKGSQNGWEHSGKEGDLLWHTDPKNIEQTLSVIERLVDRYKDSPNLIGIELLNEPRWDVPLKVLVDYYKKGYEIVRKYCSEEVAVICHDGFRSKKWENVFPKDEFKNLILDTHLYQCFSDQDKKLSVEKHLKKIHGEWADLIKNLSEDLPVMVGEWSLGLDPICFKGMDENEKNQALRSYGLAQIEEFDKSWGWFFWTLKTENMEGWSLINCVEKGLLL